MGATINLRCKNLELPMSLMGQKRTRHGRFVMSALPPKAAAAIADQRGS
jgi:hypothetical protein